MSSRLPPEPDVGCSDRISAIRTSAQNIFWQVGAQTTLDSTAHLEGPARRIPYSWLPVRISQYVYLAIRSKVHSTAELAALIGVAPDKTSKHAPWELHLDEPMRVDDQIDALLARLDPTARAAIGALTDCRVTLEIVRYLDDEDGDDEHHEPRTDGIAVIPGQHQLLGFHLSRQVLDALAAMHASIDCDEYG